MFLRSVRWLIGVVAILSLSPLRPVHAQDFLSFAIPLAQQSQRDTSVPASVTLAQAAWETGRGRSPIGQANNFFGIKAAGAADEDVNIGSIATGWIWAWTREWEGNRYVDRRERFRTYRTMADSFRDHGVLLATTPRYADAMRAVDDPREFARRVAAAGYATSPTYAADLISLMDAEDLYKYDLPRNAADLVATSPTVTVNPNDIFQIYLDVKNTGFGTWSPDADYYLASVNENRFGAEVRQNLDQLVPPEHVKRWAITMIAPRDAGTYRTIWRLKHGATNFGPEVSIQVQVVRASTSDDWAVVGASGLGLVACTVGVWFWRRRKIQKTLPPFRRAGFPRS
jgi:hypothetical protein